MKRLFALSAAVLAASAFSVTAAENQIEAKAPMLMTDAQMAEVVAGKQPGAGFGICTATFKAEAGGAIERFQLSGDPVNLPGNGNMNGHGHPPGFGLWTAKGDPMDCAVGGPPPG